MLLERATLDDSAGFHGNQNRVDAASYRQLPLNERRHEHGANLALLRIEREIPELRRGNDARTVSLRCFRSPSGLAAIERDFGRPLHTASITLPAATVSSLASAPTDKRFAWFQLPR